MRHKVMTEIETADGVIVYDSQSIDWTTFDWTLGYQRHFITEPEILKGYILAYNFYNDVNYEAIIFLLNNISDPWDIIEGTEIRIPALSDVQNFLLNNMK